jgi:hypothetical protein
MCILKWINLDPCKIVASTVGSVGRNIQYSERVRPACLLVMAPSAAGRDTCLLYSYRFTASDRGKYFPDWLQERCQIRKLGMQKQKKTTQAAVNNTGSDIGSEKHSPH